MEQSSVSVLIVDDSRSYSRSLARQLTRAGYTVFTVNSMADALAFMSHQGNPTFVIVDRQLEGNPVENGDLGKLIRVAGQSHVVVYTQKDELTESQIRHICSQGAKRVLDRTEMLGLVDNIGKLVREFDELLELASELADLISQRRKLMTALVGADVGVTVIDTEFYCWFASPTYERFVGGRASGLSLIHI